METMLMGVIFIIIGLKMPECCIRDQFKTKLPVKVYGAWNDFHKRQ